MPLAFSSENFIIKDKRENREDVKVQDCLRYQSSTDAEKVGFLTKSINLAIEKERNRYLGEYGLTAAQTDVLQYVSSAYQKGIELNQVDIEREFNLSNPTVTGILKRLEAKDFIVKRESKKDHRYKWICITEKAQNLFNRSIHAKGRIEDCLFRGVPEEQRSQAIAALETMLENMKQLNSQVFND